MSFNICIFERLKMTDIEITQKEIEDKLFNFIEENFGKKKI